MAECGAEFVPEMAPKSAKVIPTRPQDGPNVAQESTMRHSLSIVIRISLLFMIVI